MMEYVKITINLSGIMLFVAKITHKKLFYSMFDIYNTIGVYLDL